MTDATAPLTAPPRWLAIPARHPFVLLALLGVLLWLPGILSLPALDRDESRFAQSSRQMVESGNLVDIRFGHVPRYKKPVGIYWLQAATGGAVAVVTGDDSRIWSYRLPSLLGAIAAAWLTVWCALAVTGAEVALLSGLLMLGNILLTAEATIATTDAVLLACALGMQGVLLRVWRAAHDPTVPPASTRLVLLGWTAAAAGALVKFPVVPGVGLATIVALVAWTRDWRWLGGLKPVRGLLLAAVLVSPWLVAIELQSHGAFIHDSLGGDFATKIAGGQESHGAPPGYFLLLSAVTFWPGILFAAPAIVVGLSRRTEPAMRFFLSWLGGWWLVVEAVPTKLPHYILPAYPALAILCALFILSPPAILGRLAGWIIAARWLAVLQFLVGLVLVAAAPILLLQRYGAVALNWWLVAPAGLGALFGLLALVLLRRRPADALLSGLAALLILVPTLTTAVAPRLTQLWISERLKPMVAGDTRPGDPPPALAGFEEPSLVFALGPDVVLTDGAGAANAGARNGGLALVEDRERGAFLARLAELAADADAVDTVSGFNYSRGKPAHVTLYRVTKLPTP